jgi:predicted HicB family RNase H-like nuclease
MVKGKDFRHINNPALQFISEVEPLEAEQDQPQKKKATPKKEQAAPKKETKSKRLNLLIYPSVYKACKKKADTTGESINEIINTILKDYFTKE